MKKIIILFVFLLLYFARVEGNIQHVIFTYENKFDSLLNVAEKELGGCCDATIQYFSSNSFRIIYDSSSVYVDEIKKALADSNNNNAKKLICIYGIQKVDLNTYIDFASYSYVLYKNKLLNEELLDKIFFPRGFKSNISMRLASHYKHNKVRILFKGILSEKRLSKDFRKKIEYAFSGNMLKERQKMEAAGYEE